ncbi:hypothetical protein [Peptoniphilus asaccharolyticus]
MSFKITGLNELKKSFENLEKSISDLEGQYDFDEIFNSKFMKTHTNHDSIYSFFEAHNIPTSQDEFEAFSDEKLDKIIQENTKFNSWENMYDYALEEFVDSKLDW